MRLSVALLLVPALGVNLLVDSPAQAQVQRAQTETTAGMPMRVSAAPQAPLRRKARSKGSLRVRIVQRARLTPRVSVTGPQRKSWNLTSSEVLRKLPVGRYRVTPLATSTMGAAIRGTASPAHIKVRPRRRSTVEVTFPRQPPLPPAVWWTTPPNGSTVSGPVTLSADTQAFGTAQIRTACLKIDNAVPAANYASEFASLYDATYNRTTGCWTTQDEELGLELEIDTTNWTRRTYVLTWTVIDSAGRASIPASLAIQKR